MTTMRSCLGTNDDSAFSSEVLPEPVPPATMTLRLRNTQISRKRRAASVMAPYFMSCSTVRRSLGKRRMRDADAAARGRRQDGADAAAVGQAGVEHRMIGGHGLADELRDVAHRRLERVIGGEARVGALEAAALLDVDLLEAVDHDLGDLVVAQVGGDGREEAEQRLREDCVGDGHGVDPRGGAPGDDGAAAGGGDAGAGAGSDDGTSGGSSVSSI